MINYNQIYYIMRQHEGNTTQLVIYIPGTAIEAIGTIND